MSVIQAMDKLTSKQLGENGNVEYTWSNNIRERVIQFYVQLVRTSDTSDLEKQLHSMLQEFTWKDLHNYKNFSDILAHEEDLTYLYTMIAHTRDITNGKGEYNLAYMMIWVWYQYYPQLAKRTIRRFVILDRSNEHPYGSWKDLKYMCEYVRERTGMKDHPLINYCIDLMIEQLQKDEYKRLLNQPISLAARWIPREKSSKFGWIYKKFVRRMYSGYFETSAHHGKDRQMAAYKKASMLTRKKLSSLNKYIDTTQIKMCGQEWRTINFNNVTSITMQKCKAAFQNVKRSSSTVEQRSTSEDRVLCSHNLEAHVKEVMEGSDGKVIHGKRASLYGMVKSAMSALSINHTDEIDKNIINLQWNDNASQNTSLGKIIPMCDTSGSMETDNCIPLYSAIGLSLRVSQMAEPLFRDRILTFSATPEWVNVSEYPTFVDKVQRLRTVNWGMNTNFYSAMKLILDSIVEAQIPPENVDDLTLAVFSDMQIDCASNENMNTLYENIKEMYANAGLQSVYRMPYTPPHILFWNLRSTSGFPCLSTTKNTTMLSGYSPVLLNAFCNKGMDALREYSPYRMMKDILSNERYKCQAQDIIELHYI